MQFRTLLFKFIEKGRIILLDLLCIKAPALVNPADPALLLPACFLCDERYPAMAKDVRIANLSIFIAEILIVVIESGASDIHIPAAVPVRIKCHNAVVAHIFELFLDLWYRPDGQLASNVLVVAEHIFQAVYLAVSGPRMAEKSNVFAVFLARFRKVFLIPSQYSGQRRLNFVLSSEKYFLTDSKSLPSHTCP